MKILFPVRITPDMLAYSTVLEDDYPEWSASASYTRGNRVIVLAEHNVYEAVEDNSNQPPASSPEAWMPVGKTNRWRMFDDKIGTTTTAQQTFSVVLRPGLITGIALFGVSAASVRIRMADATHGLLFDRTYSMTQGHNSWWRYFFLPRRRRTSLYIDGLPTSRDPEIEITVSASDGEVAVGTCVLGRVREYGTAPFRGASVGIEDFSRKTRDPWGNWEIVERTYSDVARWTILLDNADIDALVRDLATVRATAAVYIGSEIYDSTMMIGFYRSFEVVIEYARHSLVNLELEGLEK